MVPIDGSLHGEVVRQSLIRSSVTPFIMIVEQDDRQEARGKNYNTYTLEGEAGGSPRQKGTIVHTVPSERGTSYRGDVDDGAMSECATVWAQL